MITRDRGAQQQKRRESDNTTYISVFSEVNRSKQGFFPDYAINIITLMRTYLNDCWFYRYFTLFVQVGKNVVFLSVTINIIRFGSGIK
jgi:hypothetical protein